MHNRHFPLLEDLPQIAHLILEDVRRGRRLIEDARRESHLLQNLCILRCVGGICPSDSLFRFFVILIQLFLCLIRQMLHVDFLKDQLIEVEVLDVQGVCDHLNGLGNILCIEYRDGSMTRA